ncbi:MAG: hypothetical protein RL380_59 [Verrucomicrobiota bacterium]
MKFAALLGKKWTPYLLLALATLLVWGHTVKFDFVWDDNFFITKLPAVRSVTNIPAMFSSIEAQAVEPYRFRVFRPLRTAHYAVLHALDGHEIPQPWIFHLANVLWHGATAMMLFAATARLWRRLNPAVSELEVRAWALCVALGFAVNPVTAEVVCWAKCLDDILATFFALACLHQLLASPDNVRARWWALLWCGLACYAKESAVPLAVLPFFLGRGVHKLGWRAAAQWTIPFVLVCAAYTAHRGFIIERQSQVAPISGSHAQTLVDMAPVVTSYVRLLCGVPPFLADYNFMKGGFAWTAPAVLGGTAVLALLTGAGIWAWRRENFRLAGLGLLWTGLFLLPVANVLPMMQYMAERFLYLPLAGWVLALAGAAWWRRGRGALLAVVAGAVVLVWGGTAWVRSWIWQDELVLYVRTYEAEPRGQRMAHNAVAAILQLPHVAKFFVVNPVTDAYEVREVSAAEDRTRLVGTLTEAVRLTPTNHLALELLGIALAKSGDPAAALVPFRQAVQLRAGQGDYHLNLARAELACGHLEAARLQLAAARAVATRFVPVLAVECELAWKSGELMAARVAAIELNRLEPTAANSNLLFQIEARLASPRP